MLTLTKLYIYLGCTQGQELVGQMALFYFLRDGQHVCCCWHHCTSSFRNCEQSSLCILTNTHSSPLKTTNLNLWELMTLWFCFAAPECLWLWTCFHAPTDSTFSLKKYLPKFFSDFFPFWVNSQLSYYWVAEFTMYLAKTIFKYFFQIFKNYFQLFSPILFYFHFPGDTLVKLVFALLMLTKSHSFFCYCFLFWSSV